MKISAQHIYKPLLFLAVTMLYLSKLFLFDKLCVPLPAVEMYSGTWWDIANGMTRLAISMVCASLVLATNKRWPTIVLMVLLDIWILCNLIYYRINLVYLNWGVIKLATNALGFENSILPALTPHMLWIPLTTLAAELLMLLSRGSQDVSRRFAVCVVAGIVCVEALAIGARARFAHDRFGENFTISLCSPIRLPEMYRINASAIELETVYYIQMHSIAMYFVRECYNATLYSSNLREVSLTEQEKEILAMRIHAKTPPSPVQGSLVVILLESFESWLLDTKDANDEYVCWRLRAWMNRHPVLFANRVKPERKYGMSGDGQMITMTGLLPLLNGVACNEFGTNTYPNYAHFYEESTIINPSRGVWNQDVVSVSYGFRNMIQSTDDNIYLGMDDTIFSIAIHELEKVTVPTCLLTLSHSMHLPFNLAVIPVELDSVVPPVVANYIGSARFTDEHLGRLLEWIDNAPQMVNATIVIAADHSILTQEMDPDLSHSHDIPLIIKSPCITENRVIEDEVYQMDIFPTILHAIGQENYYWSGLGEDLLQSEIDRTISEEEAFVLSDKIIRADYFSNR